MTSLTEIIQAAPPNGNIRVEFKKASAVAAEEVTFCQDLWMSRLLQYKTFCQDLCMSRLLQYKTFVKTFGCQDFCNIRLLQYSLPRPLDVKTFAIFFAQNFGCQNFCNITLSQYSLPRPLDVKTFSVKMKASDILIAIVNCLHRHPQL